jgi:hypothetical protein
MSYMYTIKSSHVCSNCWGMFRQSNKHIEGVSNVCKNNTEVCDWQLVGSMTESSMLAFVQEVICRVEIAASIGFRHNHSRKMCVADGPFAISKCVSRSHVNGTTFNQEMSLVCRYCSCLL